MILSTTTNNSLKKYIGSEFEMLSIDGAAMFMLSDKSLGVRTSEVQSVSAKQDTVTFKTENSTYIFRLEKGESFDSKCVIGNRRKNY